MSNRVTFLLIGYTWSASLGLGQSLSEVEGFIEPYRTIDVASAETGRIDAIHVTIGQMVKKGAPLASLDDELQRALCDIADKQANAVGAIEAAKADQSMHETRMRKLEKLSAGGYARPEELFRARADYAIATARVRQAEENQVINQAELNRYKIQLRRRTVTAPVAGIISSVTRDPGEFVSPTDPYVTQMIQVNPLIAVFNVTSAEAFDLGAEMTVRIGTSDLIRQGTIESIAPMINAESGTTQVRIRIDNADYRLKAGQKCWLPTDVATEEEPLKQAARPSRNLLMPRK